MKTSTPIPYGLESLLGLKDADRALVATFLEGQMVVQALHAMPLSDLEQSSPVSTVLAQVAKHLKPLLVLDSEQEVLFHSLPEERRRSVRSAICVPILDSGERLLGLLYADNQTRVGNFSYADRDKLVGEADKMAPQLAAFMAENGRRPPRSEPVVTTNHLMIIGILAAVAFLWFAVGALLSRPSPPLPPSQPVASLEKASPNVCVSSFLAMLAGRDFVGIQRVLSKKIKQRLPGPALGEQLQGWLGKADYRSDLNYRVTRQGTGVVTGHRAEVIVDTWEKGGTHRESWRVWVVQEDGRWLIDAMDGGGKIPPPLAVAAPR